MSPSSSPTKSESNPLTLGNSVTRMHASGQPQPMYIPQSLFSGDFSPPSRNEFEDEQQQHYGTNTSMALPSHLMSTFSSLSYNNFNRNYNVHDLGVNTIDSSSSEAFPRIKRSATVVLSEALVVLANGPHRDIATTNNDYEESASNTVNNNNSAVSFHPSCSSSLHPSTTAAATVTTRFGRRLCQQQPKNASAAGTSNATSNKGRNK